MEPHPGKLAVRRHQVGPMEDAHGKGARNLLRRLVFLFGLLAGMVPFLVSTYVVHCLFVVPLLW